MRARLYSSVGICLLVIAGLALLFVMGRSGSTAKVASLGRGASTSNSPNLLVEAEAQSPVTLRYVPASELAALGSNGPVFRTTDNTGASASVPLVQMLSEPIFWITNHTDSTLSVSLYQIEVKTGSAWTARGQPIPPPSRLYVFGPSSRKGSLAPHQAGYASMLFQVGARIAVPTNDVWRMEASVAEMLTGLDKLEAGVRQMPEVMKMRSRLGTTNIPINPLSSEVTRWGHHRVVYSEEVSQP